jgi:hypothetical protein
MNVFGSSSSQHGQSHYPTLNLVILSDAFSAEPLGVAIGKYESSERELAHELFEKLSSNDVLLLDRGLGGKQIYRELEVKKVSFVHRVSTRGSCLAEVKKFTESGKTSAIVELKLSASEMLKIRLVRGQGYSPNEPLVYVTNLFDDEKYRSSEIHELYKSRWKVETNIGHLKNTLGLEKIKSKNHNSVLQDIYAHLIVLSLAAKAEISASKKRGLHPERDALSIKFIISLIAGNVHELCHSTAKKAWRSIVTLAQQIIWKKQPNRKYPRYSRQPQSHWSQERSHLKKGLKRKNSR